MDTENIDVQGDATVSSPSKTRLSSSPRKRAFREINASTEQDDTAKTKVIPEDTGLTDEPQAKRHKLRPTQDEYPDAFTAHVAWTLEVGTDGAALLVEESCCHIGTSDGRVIQCDLDGDVTHQWLLSSPVGALFRDKGRLYAWCRAEKSYDRFKGALFDLSFQQPLKMFELKDFGNLVVHASMVDGCLALGDNKGNIGVFTCDGVALWTKEQQTVGDGNFFAADDTGVYVAHKKLVRRYDVQNGDILWEYACAGGRGSNISGGCEDNGSISIESSGRLTQLNKTTGEVLDEYAPYRQQGAGVCAGNRKLITGNNPTVIFDTETKKETHRVYIPARIDQSVAKFPDSEKLYLFWDKLYCLDLSEDSLKSAKDGKYSRTYTHKYEKQDDEVDKVARYDLGTVTDARVHGGVILECVTDQSDGGNSVVKVMATDEGKYNGDWPVMFPLEFRQPGQKYIVDELLPSQLGKFYRVAGAIAKYIPDERTIANDQDDGESLKARDRDDQMAPLENGTEPRDGEDEEEKKKEEKEEEEEKEKGEEKRVEERDATLQD